MDKFIFKRVGSDDIDFPETDVKIDVKGNCLTSNDLLRQFKCFLLACGYQVRGNIEIVPEFIEDDAERMDDLEDRIARLEGEELEEADLTDYNVILDEEEEDEDE